MKDEKTKKQIRKKELTFYLINYLYLSNLPFNIVTLVPKLFLL